MSLLIDKSEWMSKKLKPMFNLGVQLGNHGTTYSPGNVWSIKKEMAIHEYIKPYVTIIRKNREKWFYYDPFCGSGLIKFDKKILDGVCFPGSPIITLSRREDFPFTKYFMSDSDDKAIQSLNLRLEHMKVDARAKKMTFTDSLDFIKNQSSKHTSCLAIIDPVGIKEIPWSMISKILALPSTDMIELVNSQGLKRCFSAATKDKDYQLGNFLGDNSWQQCKNECQIIEKYVEKIKKLKKYVLVIPVYRTKDYKQYDLILATDSRGGEKVLTYLKDRLDSITTELIKNVSATASGRLRSLNEFL